MRGAAFMRMAATTTVLLVATFGRSDAQVGTCSACGPVSESGLPGCGEYCAGALHGSEQCAQYFKDDGCLECDMHGESCPAALVALLANAWFIEQAELASDVVAAGPKTSPCEVTVVRRPVGSGMPVRCAGSVHGAEELPRSSPRTGSGRISEKPDRDALPGAPASGHERSLAPIFPSHSMMTERRASGPGSSRLRVPGC